MNKLIKNKWMLVAYGLLLLIGGVLTAVFAIVNTSIVVRVMSLALATSLFIIGLMNIVAALIAHTSEFFTGALVFGSVAIAMGVVFCVDQLILGTFLLYFLGAMFLSLGAVLVVKAILAIKYKLKGGWVFCYCLSAAIIIALGVLILVFQHKAEMVLYTVVGIALAIMGLVETWLGLKILTKKKLEEEEKAKKEEEGEEPEEEKPAEEKKEKKKK